MANGEQMLLTSHRGRALLHKYLKHYEQLQERLAWFEEENVLLVWFDSEYSDHTEQSYIRYRQWLAGYLKELGHYDLAKSVGGLVFPASKISHRIELINTKKSKTFNQTIDPCNDKKADSRVLHNDKGLLAAQLTRDEIDNFFKIGFSERKPNVPLYKDGRIVCIYFQLIAMTGIRPSEWCRVKIVENLVDSVSSYGFGISVIGAEKGANKGKGTVALTRHLNCNHWTDYEKDMLRALVKAMVSIDAGELEVSATLDKMLNNYKSTFRLISKRTFGHPSYLTFYDGRHLYAAEFRRAKAGNKFALASAMGHTDIINQRYYGDYKETDNERVFRWSLALPIQSEELIVKANAERRHERTLERIAKTFGREGSRNSGSLGSWDYT